MSNSTSDLALKNFSSSLDLLEFSSNRLDLKSHHTWHKTISSILGSSISNLLLLPASSSPFCNSYFSFRCTSEGPASLGIEVTKLPTPPLYSKTSSSSGSGKQQRGWAYSCWFRLATIDQLIGRHEGRHEAIVAKFTSAGNTSSSSSSTTNTGLVETEIVLVWEDSKCADPTSLIVRTNIGSVITGPLTTNNTSSSITSSTMGGALGGFLSAASTTSGRKPQYVECLNIQRDSLPGRWSHLVISQSNIKSTFGRSSKLTVVLNGRIRLDTQYLCQPLPFSKVNIGGAGFVGQITQPHLYGQCLSSTHISSLYSRGPNSATLTHALAVPVPANLAPEIVRAGLSTSQLSLEFYSGESAAAVSDVYLSHHAAGGAVQGSTSKGSDFTAGRSGVSNAGHGSEFCVPPVLFYLSPQMTEKSFSTAIDGQFIQISLNNKNTSSRGKSKSSTEGLAPCVAWYSKGATYGDVLLEDSKSAMSEQLPAVVGYETHLTGVSTLVRTIHDSIEEESHLSLSLLDAPIASFGLSVRAIYQEVSDESHESHISKVTDNNIQKYDFGHISAQSFHSVGGSMRLLELLRILPMPSSSSLSQFFSSSLSYGINSLAILIRDDQSHREEFFQMLGFVSLSHILREHVQRARSQLTLSAESLERKHQHIRLRTESSVSVESSFLSNSNPTSALISASPSTIKFDSVEENESDVEANHPITENVWESVRNLLFCTRRAEAVPSDNLAGGSPWNHLFCQAGRYLLCDWALWTDPLIGDAPTSSGPSSLHALLDRMTCTVVISPTVVSNFSSILSDLACASPIDFSTYCGVDFQRACDGYLSCLKSLSLSLVQVQLKEQSFVHPWLIDETIFAEANVDQSESTSLRLDAISFAIKRAECMSTSCNSVKSVCMHIAKVVEAWSSTLSCLSLAPLGATIVTSKSGAAPTKSLVDLNKVQHCVEALLRFCAHTCHLHSEFQEQQEGLLKIQNDLYMKRFSRLRQQQQQVQQPSMPPFHFVEAGRNSQDPFSEGCRTGIELLTRLLKSFPNIVHPIVESVGGLMTITSCSEAPCEKVTLSVLKALPVIVALRRQVDPRKYGEVAAPGTRGAEQLSPEQEAAAKAAAKRAAILSEKAKRERLCRVLWNTLEEKAINATSALAAAAIELILSPDIPYFTSDPSSLTLSGSNTQGGGSGSGGSGGGSLRNGRIERANSSSTTPAASGDFLHSRELGGKILCPEAIPIVFLLLSMSNSRMIRKRKAASLLRANPWLPPSDLCARVGCLALEAGSIPANISTASQENDREISDRMQCVHDLSLLIKGARGSNAHMWLEERGWQISILGLILVPHTLKGAKWSLGIYKKNVAISVCVMDDISNLSNSSEASSALPSSEQRSFGKGSHGARSADKQATSTISAIAADMLICLHCTAFEYEEGSNVFLSTLASLTERYKNDPKTIKLLSEADGENTNTSTSPLPSSLTKHSVWLQSEVSLGLAFILAGVFDRISRERPRLSRYMRSNILRMLLFTLCRLQGKPLLTVCTSALPVIIWMREQKQKLEGSDLWLILRVLVTGILVPSAGLLRGWAPPSFFAIHDKKEDNFSGTICTPDLNLFHESVSLLQSLVSNEIQTLHDPEIQAKEAAQSSASRLSMRRVPSFFSGSEGSQSARKEVLPSTASADFYSSMMTSPGGIQNTLQSPSSSLSLTDPYSLSENTRQKSPSDGGSRVDAVLFVLSGLNKVIESTDICLAAADRCEVDEPPFKLPISASTLHSSASEIQGLAVVHVLSMLNNANFGPWRRCIEHYTDQAFMMGRGKSIPVGGFKTATAASAQPVSASSIAPPSDISSRQSATVKPATVKPTLSSENGTNEEGDVDLLDISLASPFENTTSHPQQTIVFDDPFASIIPSASNEQAMVTHTFPISSNTDYDPFGLANSGKKVSSSSSSSSDTSLLFSEEVISLATSQPPPPIDRAKAVFAALEPALVDVDKRYEITQTYNDFILSETNTNTLLKSSIGVTLFQETSLKTDDKEVQADNDGDTLSFNDKENLNSIDQAENDDNDDVQAETNKIDFENEDDKLTLTNPLPTISDSDIQLKDLKSKIIEDSSVDPSLTISIPLMSSSSSSQVHPKWLRKLLLSETLPVHLSLVTAKLDNSALSDHRKTLFTEELERHVIRSNKETKLSSRVRVHWRAIRLMLSRHHRISLLRSKQRTAQSKQHYITSSINTSVSPDDIPLIKFDTHESRKSRIRMRLLSVRGDRLKAMTYSEYGRQGVPVAAAKIQTGGEDVARALAMAGALKKTELVRTTSGDDEPEDIIRGELTDQDGDDATDDFEGKINDDDDTDQASDVRSVAASTIAPIISSNNQSIAEEESTFVPDITEDIAQRSTMSSMSNLSKMPSAQSLLVKPAGSGPGTFYLHTARRVVVWEPRDPHETNKDLPFSSPDRDSVFSPTREIRFKCSDITAIFLRCYRLNDIACEIFTASYGGPRVRRYFFVFPSTSERDAMVNRVIECMPRSVLNRLLSNAGKSRSTENGELLGNIYGDHAGHAVAYSYIQRPFQRDSLSASLSTIQSAGAAMRGNGSEGGGGGGGGGGDVAFTHSFESNFRRAYPGLLRAWRNRDLSTFDYLMAVNTLAGRSYNDITQYPVFPWILSDYLSQELDLTSPSSFRDLSRPLGALTSDRLKEFRMRYETFDDDVIPKFMYGSHYSTAVGTVVHYLLRLYPFTNLHVAYQSGHFDVADRLFASIADAWTMNTTSLSEVKELTPEFYTSDSYLINSSRHKFGDSHNGQQIDHVQLPPWAKGSPLLFQKTMRASLESDLVSSSIHSWVDLVFGKKQRGEEAAQSDNVFYYMTYAGKVDWDSITDPSLRRATQSQITHYGQTPLQILLRSHDERGPFPTILPPPFVPHSTSSLISEERDKLLLRISNRSERSEDICNCGIQLLSQENSGIINRTRSSSTVFNIEGQTNSSGNNNTNRLAPLHRSNSTALGGGTGGGFGGLGRMVMTVAAGLAEATGATTTSTYSLSKSGISSGNASGNRAINSGGGRTTGSSSGSSVSSSSKVGLMSLPGLSRPLSSEMRMYAQLKDSMPPINSLTSSTILLEKLEGVSLELNRAFSHVCTIPILGGSFWRPDAPSSLPIRVSECFGEGARPDAIALVGVAEEIDSVRSSSSSSSSLSSSSTSKSHRSNSIDFQTQPQRPSSSSFSLPSNPSASVLFSLGDVLVQGSAPPPATLSVRIELKNLHSLIEFNKVSDWPRNDSDPYITRLDASAVGQLPTAESSDVITATRRPFAFPLRYQRVLELTGAASLSQSDKSVYSLGVTSAKAARETIIAEIERMLGPGVTSEHLSSAVSAMESKIESASSVFHVWWPIAPEGYVALGCVITAATIAPFVEVVPETPIASTTVEDLMIHGTNSTSFDFNSNEIFPVGICPPSPRVTNTKEASLDTTTTNTTTTEGNSSGGHERIRAGVSFEIRPVQPHNEAILCVHVGLLTSSPLKNVFTLPNVDLDLPPRPRKTAAFRSAAGVVTGGGSNSTEEAWYISTTKEKEFKNQDQQLDDENNSNIFPLASPASVVGSNGRSAADFLVTPDLAKEKIATLRASRSRGFALYTVQNKASTFVVPVPVSVSMQNDQTNTKNNSNSCLILSPTSIPPAPEHIDATLHKAHTLSKAVAYDFSPSVLSILMQQSVTLEVKVKQQHADSIEGNIGSSNEPRLITTSSLNNFNTRFPDQHWSCDATCTSSQPITVILRQTPFGSVIRQTNLAVNATNEPSGFSHGWDFSSMHVLTGPPKEHHKAFDMSSSYSFSEIPDLEVNLRAPVVCVRVRSSAQAAALLFALGLPPSHQLTQAQLALQAVPQNTLLSIDANGHVDVFNIFSQPREEIESSQSKLESAVVTGARVLGYLESLDRIPDVAKQPYVPRRLKESFLPHSRIRIVRLVTQAPNALVKVQLTNVRHEIPIAITGETSNSQSQQQGLSTLLPPCISSFPIALGDLLSGGIAITSSGRCTGLVISAIDAREKSSSFSSLSTSSGLPSAPFAQKRSAAASAAASAADIGRSVLSSIDRTLAASIPQDLSSKEKTIINTNNGYLESLPSWAGVSSTSSNGGLNISGELALPINRTMAACALALDEDALVCAYEDGTIMFWRLSGTHPVNSLVTGISARTRPEAVIRSPSTGASAATCVSVWRDGDAAIIGYIGEAWLVELSRARPLQQFLLSTPSCATDYCLSQSLNLSQPVCTGACFNSDGSVVLASTVFAMIRADNVSASARHSSSILHAGPAFSEISLFSSESSSSDSEPSVIASIQVRSKVTCLSRIRGGGTGDFEGSGALIALGLSDGTLSILDGSSLNILETWILPQKTPCFSIDISPCTGYLIAGCANGIVAAIALSSFLVTVPCEAPEGLSSVFEMDTENSSVVSSSESSIGTASTNTSEQQQIDSFSNSERAINAVNVAKGVGKAFLKSFWGK